MTYHKVNEDRTVFVTLTDLNYLRRAVQTIKDLRIHFKKKKKQQED